MFWIVTDVKSLILRMHLIEFPAIWPSYVVVLAEAAVGGDEEASVSAAQGCAAWERPGRRP